MKPLPPGMDHNAAVKRVAKQFQDAADTAIDNHVGPRPEGTKTTVTSEIAVKSRRTHTAKV